MQLGTFAISYDFKPKKEGTTAFYTHIQYTSVLAIFSKTMSYYTRGGCVYTTLYLARSPDIVIMGDSRGKQEIAQ